MGAQLGWDATGGQFLDPRSSSTTAGQSLWHIWVEHTYLRAPTTLLRLRRLLGQVVCVVSFQLLGPLLSQFVVLSEFQRRVHLAWPAAWTRGGVEPNCKANASHGVRWLCLLA